MTILLFTPYCKDDECEHKFEEVHINLNMKITEDELETIKIELDDPFNYCRYVMVINDILEFYGCDFQVKILNSEEIDDGIVTYDNGQIKEIFSELLEIRDNEQPTKL